jgi:L-iditol 2-dehydrogenase
MRVAVYYNNSDIRVEERPVPPLGDYELLVRVESSGICGSDVMEWYRIKKAPLVLGHEIAGVITEKGKRVDKFKVGDRVFVSHHVPCNTCHYCLAGKHSLCDTLRSTNFDPGGFSEMIRVPSINVDRGTFILPDSVSFDQGTFVEPLACVLRGLGVADFRPAQRVLVLGSGISGLLHIKALRALGAGRVVVTDVKNSRLELAKSFGADAALHARQATPEKLREVNGGRLFDLVVTCAGAAEVAEQAFKFAERGGTVLFFAPLEPGVDITVPQFDIWRDQISVVSTYAGCPVDIERAIELLASGRITVDDMISHRLPLDEIERGFRLVLEGKESVKVIIKPQE